MSTPENSPVGKWVIVRSDRHVVSVDKTDHAYILGRERRLPSAQLLSDKYASRKHIVVIWHPPYLCMIQEGKNPSFIGPSCTPVPAFSNDAAVTSGESTPLSWEHAQLRFAAMADVKEATTHLSAGHVITVNVPVCDPMTVTQPPDRHSIDAATVHFPEELGLPTLTVRFEGADDGTREGATAAVTTKTTAEMLAVPSARTLDGDDDDEFSNGGREVGMCSTARAEDSEGGSAAAGGAKPVWSGLLDVALQQQHRSQKTSCSSPATQASEGRLAPQGTPAAADPLPHEIGSWEWKKVRKGGDDDPKSWSKYSRAVEELLEKAYKDISIVKIEIPDSVMFGKRDASGCTYGVCFAEKALGGAMVQYSIENPGKFCVIRRTGGPLVDRRRAKTAHVIPSPSSSEQDESETEESLSEASDSESIVSSSSASSSSSTSSSSSDDSEAPRKKRLRRH
ncbi:hypothetical protein JKF63_03540 [Porcisia hertigi]|uniref:FHA domain-containing protein n=1 Tax=Porcisia hertigi TaxID=2761500 RepID=A0A836I8K5_9TRYP|nr:hypothetical protein JKF63_03540 [Porcisia hertigi]